MAQYVTALFLLVLASASLASAQNSHKGVDPQREAAIALEQQGKAAEAEAAWQAYGKAHPGNPEPFAHLGLLEARQEHYRESISFYRKALSIDPKMPGLRLNLGLALFKDGQLKDAATEFETLYKNTPETSPESMRVSILLGMCHYGLGQYAEAVPLLKRAAAQDTKNLPLRLALAHSCLWSKQYQCVMDTYHEILTLDAESAEADMLAGEALDEMKDSTGAINMFRAAAKANPKEPNVHFGLGYLLWTQKQYLEAASEFRAELANDPAHAQATLYLGDTTLQLNKPEEARPLLEKALQLDPSAWLAHLDLGIMASDAGRNDDALRELQFAAKLQPNDVNVHWRLGRLYRTLGRKEEAKAEFDAASKLNKAADEELYRKIQNGAKRSDPLPSDAPRQNQ